MTFAERSGWKEGDVLERALVRIRVDPAGGLEAWVIGKDDPLGPGRPVLVHHFAWRRPP